MKIQTKNICPCKPFQPIKAWNTNRRGRLSTVDLLIKVACFVTKAVYIFDIKTSRSKLVSIRKSTVLGLPLQ